MKTFRTKKTMLLSALLLGALSVGTNFGSLPTASAAAGTAQAQAATPFQEEKLDMTNKWDKVFPESKNVSHEKVTFHNRYGITLAADVYKPKNAAKDAKLAAIAVSGPFGAVKEQSSGLYAQTMARQCPRRGVA